MQRLTQKQAGDKIKLATKGKFRLVSTYNGGHKKVTIRCNDCGNEYNYLFATAIRQADKCINCNKIVSRQEKLVEFKHYVKENTKGGYLVTDKSTYISSGKPTIVMQHKTCGNTYRVNTNSFKNGHRCPYCNGNKATVKDTKWFVDKLRELTGDEYKLVEGQVYKNVKTKLLVEHTLCSNIEGYTPQDFISKHSRCHNCKLSGKKDREFTKRLLKETSGEFWLATDSHYISAKKSVKIVHKGCGETIERIPDNIFSRSIKCDCYNYSKGEHYIKQYLSKHQIKFEMSKKFDDLWDKSPKDLLRYDFYLSKESVLIEYQGVQHYKPIKFYKNISDIKALDNFAMQNLHDDMKRQYAKDNGYKLIEIPYTEDTQEKVNKYIEKCLKGV